MMSLTNSILGYVIVALQSSDALEICVQTYQKFKIFNWKDIFNLTIYSMASEILIAVNLILFCKSPELKQ